MATRKTRARRTSSPNDARYGQHMLGNIGAIASTFAHATLRDYNDLAAERIDEFAGYVKRTDIPEMLKGVTSFAKRQPTATLALSVAAGPVTTQLMRGWTPRPDSSSSKRRASKANKRRAHR